MSQSRRRAWDVAAAGAVTLLIAGFHLLFLVHAGGFWRDEVNSLNVAAAPTLHDFLTLANFDSFPFLLFPLLRGWLFLTAWAGDEVIRIFGLLMGVAVVAALWNVARSFEYTAPWVALVLFGFNATTIRFGDSLRAYGLGMLTFLLAFAAYWRFCRLGGRTRLLVAGALALLSVHAVFYNSVYLFALTAGAVVVLVRKKRFADSLSLLVVGLICALSLALYRASFQEAGAWHGLVHHDFSFPWLWFKAADALVGGSGPGGPAVWISLIIVSISISLWMIISGYRSEADHGSSDVFLFSGTTLLVGLSGHLLFLRLLSYEMGPWYFVTAMCLVAVCADTIVMSALTSSAMRLTHLIVGGAAIVAAFGAVHAGTVTRQTNVDAIALRLSRTAHPEDLIVVYPWQAGVTFRRYYSGRAIWSTLPPIGDLREHRYDLFQEQLQKPEALSPILRQVRSVLMRGGRVWVVAPGSVLEVVDRPGENAPFQLRERMWLRALGEELRTRSASCGFQAAPSGVNRVESLSLECRVGGVHAGQRGPATSE